MKSFRHTILLLAWLGIILPSCPCKILSLFGVDLHGSPEAGNTVAFQVRQAPPGFPCHCDEESSVRAVEADTDILEYLNEFKDEATASIVCKTDLAAHGDAYRVPSTRPPPATAPLPHPGRSFLPVYRL